MYVNRTISNTVKKASKSFPVILLTGPRQVGKTTLLESCANKNRTYVTLDDLDSRNLAQNDPALFLQANKFPITIDEIQYAPELLSYIKMAVDKEKKSGLFWLTGSQKFHLMRDITETLAGRVAIIDMLGLSRAEIKNRANQSQPFLPTEQWIKQAKQFAGEPLQLMDIYTEIWRGSFPKAILDQNMPRDLFYKSYIQTYIQRDIRDLTKVNDEMAFYNFLRATAARTGQLLNQAELARDVGIDQKTVKSWLSILETSGLIYLLQPYYNNVTSRIIKTPKLYFLDTGLCAYLTQWTSPEALEAGAMSGAIFETYTLSEILKSYWHNGMAANFYFYRDKDQKEIDLLVEQDNIIYPIEFKKTATPSKTVDKNFSTLKKLRKPIGPGAIICLKHVDTPLTRGIHIVPIGYI